MLTSTSDDELSPTDKAIIQGSRCARRAIIGSEVLSDKGSHRIPRSKGQPLLRAAQHARDVARKSEQSDLAECDEPDHRCPNFYAELALATMAPSLINPESMESQPQTSARAFIFGGRLPANDSRKFVGQK